MIEYTIVIPAFNEASAIAQTLQDLGQPPGCRQIIVVDDGSSDDTANLATRHGAKVIKNTYNKGYGASIKAGILACGTDHIVTFDADGQHSREALMKVVEAASGFDMFVGRRDKNSYQHWNRGLGKKILRFVANYLVNRNIPDLNSGLRVFKTDVIKKYLHLCPDGFSFSTTSTIAMFKMGHTVGYVSVTVSARRGRHSSVKWFEDGLRTFMLIVNLTALFNPMRVFLPLAALFVATSLVYFIIYSLAVRVHVSPSMVMLFITGVLIFVLGIVCEQVSAIRREMHR